MQADCSLVCAVSVTDLHNLLPFTQTLAPPANNPFVFPLVSVLYNVLVLWKSITAALNKNLSAKKGYVCSIT